MHITRRTTTNARGRSADHADHGAARRGAQLLALGATAVLLAGCSAGTGADDAAAGAAPADGSHAATGSHAAAGSHAATGSHAAAGTRSDVRAAARTDTAAPQLPEDWAGTVSTRAFAPEDPSSYLALATLYGETDVRARSAEQIEGSEFLAGSDAQCEGEAVLGGDAAHCTFTAMDGSGGERSAEVRLVPTGFGNTALLFGVSGKAGAELPVADAPVGLQTIEGQDLSAVTDEDLAEAATSAVMLGEAEEGELSEDLSADCEVADGGEHGTCELTGTPGGGGDGTWYATAQRGYDGDRAAYLFTQLPQE